MAEERSESLKQTLQQLRRANLELAAQMRRVSEAGKGMRRAASSCIGGVCSSGEGSGRGSSASGSAVGIFSATALRSAIEGDWRGALQGVLGNLVKSIGTQLRSAFGGGVGGSLVGGLLGGGLSVLLGRLFAKRQKVSVDNTVRTEVLNFPRLSSLDFASNPASRLFSGRAVARGPAFNVQVEYRGGAEELVTARVASRLADINFAQGLN